MTTPRLERKIALAPVPVSRPPIRNRARLGVAVHADTTSSARPRMIVGIPAAKSMPRGPRGGRGLHDHADAEGDEDRRAGERRGRVVQRAREEPAGEPGEQSPGGERQADAGDRREELAAGSGRQHEPLRPVSRERLRGRVSLGREHDGEHGDDEGDQQDDERERQARPARSARAAPPRAVRARARRRWRSRRRRPSGASAAPSRPASRSAM